MKIKNIKGYIIGTVFGVVLATSFSVYAEDGLTEIKALLRTGLNITLDGKKVVLDNPSINYNGSTYVKLRDAGRITGTKVEWNEKTQTVEMTNVDTAIDPTLSQNAVVESTLISTDDKYISTEELNAGNWISLRDLSSTYGVEIISGSDDSLHLNGKISISIPNSSIANKKGIIAVNTTEGDISINLVNSQTFLKSDELKKIGLIN